MIILRRLLLLTNLHLKLLSTQGTGADKLLSTQRVNDSAIGFSDEFMIVNNTDSGRIQTIVYKTVVLCLKIFKKYCL